MTNEILFFICTFLAFGAVVLISRVLGKNGLVAWCSAAVILANLITAKQISLFGMNTTLGNIMLASVFLTTDIINELYGYKESKKAVMCAFASNIVFIAVNRFACLFAPNAYDTIDVAMKQVFALSFRLTLASIIGFTLSNTCDVFLFEKIKQKFPKHLWLRNNVATILCNCCENFIVVFGGFYGIMGAAECMEVVLTMCVIETILGLLDTPFLYAARRINKRTDEAITTENIVLR